MFEHAANGIWTNHCVKHQIHKIVCETKIDAYLQELLVARMSEENFRLTSLTWI